MQNILYSFFSVLLVLGSTNASAQMHEHLTTVTENYITTLHDRIPRFCNKPNTIAIRSGNWSNPRIWSTGKVPKLAAEVAVRGGVVVNYDIDNKDYIECIEVQNKGTLRFDPQKNTKLILSDLQVLPGGTLEIGTEKEPIARGKTAKIIIKNQPLKTGSKDPQQYGNGVVVFGTIQLHGSPLEHTFIRTRREPGKGETQILLEQPVNGWNIGDTIVLPDSRQQPQMEKARDDFSKIDDYTTNVEEQVITGISPDGTTISIGRALSFDHPGAKDPNGSPTLLENGLKLMPHAINISRNVLIQSENPEENRGHVMLHGRAVADIRYAQLKDLGRTTVDELDNTILDTQGNATSIGTNQIGRYSLHAHHLIGPLNPGNSGNQFVFIGNSIDGFKKWGMTVHGSSYGLIQGNVVYDGNGSGIVTENGSEANNVFDGNIVVKINGGEKFELSKDMGGLGDGYWFMGPLNIVRNNVAASVARNGFIVYAGEGRRRRPIENNKPVIPAKRGQSAHSLDAKEINLREKSFLDFSGNEIYGTAREGIRVWAIGNEVTNPNSFRTVLKDTIAWHINRGFYAYYTDSVTVDGWIHRGDPTVTKGSNDGITHARTPVMTVRNVDIRNTERGIYARGRETSRSFFLENSYIDATENNVLVRNFNQLDEGKIQNVLHNVTFGDTIKDTVYLGDSLGDNVNLEIPNEVYVYDHNGKKDDNYQLYFNYQINSSTAGGPAPCQAADRNSSCEEAKARADSKNLHPLAFTTNKLMQSFDFASNPRISIDDIKINGVDNASITIRYSIINRKPDVHHVHFYLNTEEVKMDMNATGEFTIANIPAGTHALRATLNKKDHSKVFGSDDTISFTVGAQKRSIPVDTQEIRTQEEDIIPQEVLEPIYTQEKENNYSDQVKRASNVVLKDVPIGSWFSPYVSSLLRLGIISGYKDKFGSPTGLFGPQNPVTYGEISKISTEAVGLSKLNGKTPRNRFAKNHWSAGYIAFMESRNISVFKNPSLNIDKPASRGEVIQVIVELFGIQSTTPTGAVFEDLPATSPHAAAIEAAVNNGIISGDDNQNTFRPDQEINRAEVSKIIINAMKVYSEDDSDSDN